MADTALISDHLTQLLDLCESVGKPCEGGMDAPQVARVNGRWVHCEALAAFTVTSVAGGDAHVCEAHVDAARTEARKDGACFPFPLVNEEWVLDTVRRHWPAVIARAKARGG